MTAPVYQRHAIHDLERSVLRATHLDLNTIQYVLNRHVNSMYDRIIGKDLPNGMTKKNSISTFEAYNFYVENFDNTRHPENAKISKALAEIYGFKNSIFSPPDPHDIFVTTCYDADTCRVQETLDSDGTAPSKVEYSVRISGIDAPEVDKHENFIPYIKAMVDEGNYFQMLPMTFEETEAPIDETSSDAPFGFVGTDSDALYTAPNAEFVNSDWGMRVAGRAQNYMADGTMTMGKKKPKPWVNPKLIQNIIKIYKELGGSEKLPKDVQIDMLIAIGHFHTYQGDLATLAMNDFINYSQNHKEHPFRLVETVRQYYMDSHGKKRCGMWEMADRYMRKLGSLAVNNKNDGLKYFTSGLHHLMKSEGMELYHQKKNKLDKIMKKYKSSPNTTIQHMLAALDSGQLSKPTDIFSQSRNLTIMGKLKPLFLKEGVESAADIQAFLVGFGLVWDYPKYHMQKNDFYAKLGKVAKEINAGSWRSRTFQAIPEYNDKHHGDRYRPPVCK